MKKVISDVMISIGGLTVISYERRAVETNKNLNKKSLGEKRISCVHKGVKKLKLEWK